MNKRKVIGMVNFEDTISKAKEILDETGRIAGDAIKVQKIKIEISSKKSEISKIYTSLGRLAYKNAVEGEENAEQAAKLVAKITDKIDELKLLQENLALYKGCTICSCGTLNKEGAKYCNTCGKEV